MGYELWQGNRKGSDGFSAHELHPNQNDAEYGRYASLGELGYVQEKETIAVAAIEADPGRFAWLTLKRTAVYWTGVGKPPISWTVSGEVFLASVCGFLGIIAMWRRRERDAMVLAIAFLVFPLPYYVTHPDLRYRLPLEPIALVLAAWLLARGYGRLEVQG